LPPYKTAVGSKPDGSFGILINASYKSIPGPGSRPKNMDGPIFKNVEAGIRADPEVPFAVFIKDLDKVAGKSVFFGKYSKLTVIVIEAVQAIFSADPGIVCRGRNAG
jgi:hypothetical protein